MRVIEKAASLPSQSAKNVRQCPLAWRSRVSRIAVMIKSKYRPADTMLIWSWTQAYHRLDSCSSSLLMEQNLMILSQV